MAGGRDFDPVRFWALFRAVGARLPYVPLLGGPEGVFAVMFLLDFEAYRIQGTSITGTTWVKREDGWSTALTWPA